MFSSLKAIVLNRKYAESSSISTNANLMPSFSFEEYTLGVPSRFFYIKLREND